MMQVVQPDYFIHVGIKDGEVVSTNFAEMYGHEKNVDTTKKIMRRVCKYLRAAVVYLEKGAKDL